MVELNPNAELLDLSTKKTTQKIIYNISTSLLRVVITLPSINQIKINKRKPEHINFWLGKLKT